jgi:hypothetical protein
MLTEVHRQAQDDPIVRLSMQVRNGERLVPGEYGISSVVRKDAFDPQRALETDQILVGTQQHAARLQCAAARAARLRRPAAALRRQAGLPAQQPAQGPVQRRAVERRRAADDATADPEAAAHHGRRVRRQRA